MQTMYTLQHKLKSSPPQWCCHLGALCLQIMADGTRKIVSELLASSAPKIAANLQKRRLIPFKSLPTQMGTVAALTYCLKQHPSLLTLSQVRWNDLPYSRNTYRHKKRSVQGNALP